MLRHTTKFEIMAILRLHTCMFLEKDMSRNNIQRALLKTSKKAHLNSTSKSYFNIQPIDGAKSVLTQHSEAPDVSVIIPAYCEEETIAEVLKRVIKVSWSLGDVEIIVVDDGSTDKTGKVVAGFPFVKYIRHKINQGKGAALRTGIKHSRGKILVIQDADLEYAPEYIPSIVKPIIDNSVDMVYGSRFNSRPEGMSISHYIGNSILSIVAGFLYTVKITDIMTGQKAFRRNLLEAAELKENGFAVEIEITTIGLNRSEQIKYGEVPIPYSYRQHGVSKIGYIDGFKSLIKLFATYFSSEIRLN